MSSNGPWSRTSDNSLGDSLRRRHDRRGVQDEDRVLSGQMSGLHISSSLPVVSSVRGQARGPAPNPAAQGQSGGASAAGNSKHTGEGSHLETWRQHGYGTLPLLPAHMATGGEGGLETAGSAPQLYPTISQGHFHVSKSSASIPNEPGTSVTTPPAMQRADSSGNEKVKVLCSYGGLFGDCPTSDFGKAYHGGTTRLISLQLTDQTCFSQLLLQLASSSIGIDGNIREEDIHVNYELPGEQGVYVSITNDQDVANMYEEWVGAQSSGPPRKLRLFVETIGGGLPSESPVHSEGTSAAESHVRHGRASSVEATQASEANSNDVDAAQSPGTDAAGLAVDFGDESEPLHPEAGENNTILELLRDRMELIPKADVQVSRLLGAGGYGEVYLGKWRDATDVAVKCLSPSLIASDGDITNANPQHVADLLDEAQLLFNLRHPNVVWVYGLVLDPAADALDTSRFRTPAIVAEYMASGSLLAALARKDQSLQQGWVRVVVALDAARGMEYLHSKKIVHFDLKSANLLLAWRDRRPTCKVADFGLSKQRRQTYVSGVKPHTGTLPWMAPEIFKTPNAVGEKADVYSFAIVMWELWTWLEPHAGVPYANLLHRRMTESGFRPEQPGSPEWPESTPCPEPPSGGWQELMQSCWAEDPNLRPNFQDIVSELKKMLDAVRPAKKPQPPK